MAVATGNHLGKKRKSFKNVYLAISAKPIGHQGSDTVYALIASRIVDLIKLCHALGINRVRVVDPYDLKDTEKVITEEIAADEPSVIISRRPCALLKYVKAKPALKIDPDKCKGCTLCARNCPANCISGKVREPHVIDNSKCLKCGACMEKCKFGAITKG